MTHLTIDDVLSRVNLDMPLADVGKLVVEAFSLGTFRSLTPLLVGYEELNGLLTTNTGSYIVKIFSKNKDLETIQSNVRALVAYYEGNVSVPKLYPYKEGEYLYKLPQTHDAYLIVMEYFEGKKFTDMEPTRDDVIKITEYIARIHGLSFETHPTYDMWLTLYLAQEFDQKQSYLDSEDVARIAPVVEEFRKVDLTKLSKSIVHFDLHRENVMKSVDGRYCILDLATATYSYRVFDLATYISLFCFDGSKSKEENMRIYETVVTSYRTFRSLSDYELAVLPILIQATFASNLLIATYVQKAGLDDNPEQTLYYQFLGKKGLQMLQSS